MGASYSLAQKAINHFFRGNAQPAGGSLYLALYVTDPTASDAGTEVSGAGYARQLITFSEPRVVGDEVQTSNANKVDFGIAQGNWGNIAYFGVKTAATGGELLAFGQLPVAKDVAENDQPIFNIGTAILTFI